MPAFDVASDEDGRKEAAAAAAFLMINESLVAFSEVTHHRKQLRSELGLGYGEGRGRRRRRSEISFTRGIMIYLVHLLE